MFSFTVRIILAILAVYRLSELVALDTGPYDIFDKFRRMLGRKASSGSSTWKTLADLVNCPFCCGIWFSIFFTVLILFPTLPGDIFILFLAIAGGQTFLESLSGNTETEKK